MSEHTVAEMMAAYSQDAIDYARQTFGIELDYSEPSVQQVEDILGKLHGAMPKGFFSKLVKKPVDARQIDQVSKMMGGYVGEVMRRHWGGEWKLESDAFPGEKVVTLRVAGRGDVWPQFKAGKRLVNGPEDNVWHYFQVLRQKYVKPSASVP